LLINYLKLLFLVQVAIRLYLLSLFLQWILSSGFVFFLIKKLIFTLVSFLFFNFQFKKKKSGANCTKGFFFLGIIFLGVAKSSISINFNPPPPPQKQQQDFHVWIVKVRS
jgi:hypothetical protein